MESIKKMKITGTRKWFWEYHASGIGVYLLLPETGVNMKWLTGHVVSVALLLFMGHTATAVPMYKYTVVPDMQLITIIEGMRGVVHYTFTNLGNEPIWVFTFSLSASHPILPDPTDRAGARYFGPDASLGVEVDPGDTFKFGYFLITPKADPHPEHKGDPDFGLRTFTPNISLDLREADSITSPFLPDNSGKVKAFDVKVVDAATPEPGTIALTGSVLAVLLVIRLRNRRSGTGLPW